MVVAIPEKTLEHWASQYITYRFRSHASLWWPANGQDIEVGRYPNNRIGKSIQLEVKTCTPRSTKKKEYQEVFVDIGQLCDYLRRPDYEQPFYVIPNPDWPGVLENFTVSIGGPNITEQAFRRSGEDDWWFASWLRVLTTQEVANVMTSEISAHRAATSALPSGQFTRGTKKRLVQYEVSAGTRIATTWTGGANPEVFKWREFWGDLVTCGKKTWPQVVWLPDSAADSPVGYDDFSSMLSDGGGFDDLGLDVSASYDQVLVPFAVAENGEFERIDLVDHQETPSVDPDGDVRFGAWLALGV